MNYDLDRNMAINVIMNYEVNNGNATNELQNFLESLSVDSLQVVYLEYANKILDEWEKDINRGVVNE